MRRRNDGVGGWGYSGSKVWSGGGGGVGEEEDAIISKVKEMEGNFERN